MSERLAFDLEHAGRVAVAGADEAGRGCLAGPLVAAAVCFDYATLNDDDLAALDGVDDSKRLPATRREFLYREIMVRARQVVVVSCSPASIDRRGLHACNLDCLSRAVEAVAPAPDVVFVDGFVLPRCGRPHTALVGGDGRSAAVAASSIVAKVTRDRVMRRLHERHPEYGFDRHVGYATEAHQQAIGTYGVCELHRLSFHSVAYHQLGLLFGEEDRGAADEDRGGC